MATPASVAELLAQSLDYRQAKAAGAELHALESAPSFALVVLQVVGDAGLPQDVRLAAAAFFKNLVKTHWNDVDGNYLLPLADVEAIKSNILSLMIQVPSGPRKLLGEAVALIANSDFPDRWPNLVPELVAKLDPSSPKVNIGVLDVMHSIFGRWRALSRSDALFLEIKMVLDQFTQPYLAFMVECDRQIKATGSTAWLECMDLLIKLFYDLNCQDLPEFFEDHMADFMGYMLEYLTLSGGAAADDDDDLAGVQEHLKTDICEALALYTERYEEEFAQYMPKFVEAGWTLLTTIGPQAKFDLMVNRCLKFLTAVAKFDRNIHMFNSEQTLLQIVELIVIPNMKMRASDLEAFDDDPLDFVRHDLEGSDNETRKLAATVFLRELAEKIEGEITKVVMRYVTQFLELYSQNPQQHWLEKSTAVALFSAIAAKGQITSAGVSTTNLLIDVVGFFNTNMAPELTGAIGANHPVLKVDAIRFILSFRNQLTKAQLAQAIPMLTSLLNKEYHAAVYTYAAITLERILAVRDPVSKRPMFGEQDVSGHVREMSTHTLKVVASGSTKPEELAANEFLMKLLMRILVISGGEVKHVAAILVPQLVQIIQAISSNPSNPRFNHYCFESLGACLKYYRDYEVVDRQVVQPLFGILGADVTEFVPYVLQILTEVLSLQPQEAGVPQSFQQLLKPVLSPQLWEARGNVPALVALLQSIVARGPSLVLESQLLVPLLGVFQNLLASPSRDQYSFELLECILVSIPVSQLAQFLPQIAKLLLLRLEKSKGERYSLQLTRFVYFVAAAQAPLGAEFIIEMIDSSSDAQDVFGNLFSSVIAPRTLQIHGPSHRRVAAVGLTKLLCGTTQFVSGKYTSLWSVGFAQLAGLLTKDIADTSNDSPVADLDVSELTFGSSFSPLVTTRSKPADPVAYIGASPQQLFASEFKKVVQSPSIQAQLQQVGESEKQYLMSVMS